MLTIKGLVVNYEDAEDIFREDVIIIISQDMR